MPTIKKRTRSAKQQTPEVDIRNLARQVSDAAAVHRKNLAIAAAVVAVVIVLVAGYRFIRAGQDQKAAQLVAAAYGYYGQESAQPDYAKALDLFLEAQNKYPSTRNGAIAQYYVGNCLANLGRYDEALKAYQAFVDRYSGETFLLGLVYERMGYVESSLGKQADAIKAFERSQALSGPGVVSMELAKLYEAAGNTAKAQQEYKEISDKLAGTAWAMEAMGKVQKISPVPAPPVKNK